MKGPTARRRAARAGILKRAETKNKREVRNRDRTCRFPLCPCRRFGLFLEVSHADHKGMGGDPTGERSTPERMIYVCNWRHKESRVSIDKGLLRWVPLVADKGSNGPVSWEMKVGEDWRELAFEIPGFPVQITAYGVGALDILTREITERFQAA